MKTTLCFLFIILTHITLRLVPNSFAQDESPEYVVRVIYFLPNDRDTFPNIDEIFDTEMKKRQAYFGDLLKNHGFERKTFTLETSENGMTTIHHIKGEFPAIHYHNSPFSAREEVTNHFDLSKNIYLIAIDTGIVDPTHGHTCFRDNCGSALMGANGENGIAVVPVDTDGIPYPVAHELGHTFGLHHDFRYDYLSFVDPMLITFCAAEWLNASRYFNDYSPSTDAPTKIEMLTPTTAAHFSVSLKFKISDTNGLRQAQLITTTSHYLERGGNKVIACQSLSGESDTIEFVTNELLKDKTNRGTVDITLATTSHQIWVQVIDAYGNITVEDFTVDTASLLPQSEIISIPDVNLETAIRDQLGLADRQEITQLNMLKLKEAWMDSGNISGKIENLTGLEHAINLTQLSLSRHNISDLKPLQRLTNLYHLGLDGNEISDITPLSGLINLGFLFLNDNNISDIRPLTQLEGLGYLELKNNNISEISPLTGLTNLYDLILTGNNISDVHPLEDLVKLIRLFLVNNPIKDREPLLTLLRKNPDIKIYLKNNREPLPVTLSHFRAEHNDSGVILKWTTESEVDNVGFYIYRSTTKYGEFKVVNPTMIQGAGTTGERNEYTWTDATAKPNTVYYYRIEDVSHAGVREQLATVRLRGLVSARGKLTTRWADLKTEN